MSEQNNQQLAQTLAAVVAAAFVQFTGFQGLSCDKQPALGNANARCVQHSQPSGFTDAACVGTALNAAASLRVDWTSPLMAPETRSRSESSPTTHELPSRLTVVFSNLPACDKETHSKRRPPPPLPPVLITRPTRMQAMLSEGLQDPPFFLQRSSKQQDVRRAAPSEDRPFSCPVPDCEGRFHRKFTLHEHMKTHTGEQPHQCPVADCGKRFSTSGNLARHRKLHSLRKVSCPAAHCTRVFTSREKLVPHLKVHLARSPHTCEIEGCGKTFSTAGNLTRHRRTQHRVMPSTRPESLVRSRQELGGRVASSSGGSMPLSDLLWPTPPPVETAPSSRILEQDVQDLFECLFVESAAAANVRGGSSSSSNASMRERVKMEQARESKGFLTATYEF